MWMIISLAVILTIMFVIIKTNWLPRRKIDMIYLNTSGMLADIELDKLTKEQIIKGLQCINQALEPHVDSNMKKNYSPYGRNKKKPKIAES